MSLILGDSFPSWSFIFALQLLSCVNIVTIGFLIYASAVSIIFTYFLFVTLIIAIPTIVLSILMILGGRSCPCRLRRTIDEGINM